MTHLRTFGRFWYDFVIGDDWRIAVGVVAAVAVTALAAHHGLDWWWLLPATTTLLLTTSLVMASRPRRVGRAVAPPEPAAGAQTEARGTP